MLERVGNISGPAEKAFSLLLLGCFCITKQTPAVSEAVHGAFGVGGFLGTPRQPRVLFRVRRSLELVGF